MTTETQEEIIKKPDLQKLGYEFLYLHEFDEKDVAALQMLLREFTTHPERLTAKKLQEILSQPNFHLLVCRDAQGVIMAMASGEIVDTLESKKMYIDHVAVAENNRKRMGIGDELTTRLVELAKKNGVEKITLTSKSDRIPAHDMYHKHGFRDLPTKPFGLDLKK